MADLKGELASLKIDRTQRGAQPLALAAAPARARAPAASLCSTGCAPGRRSRSAPRWRRPRPRSAGHARPSAGTPILTASGYVVARRKAVVSAKIQGRLSELRVEEGSKVREGESHRAAREHRLRGGRWSAREAAVQRAEADLAENQRQLGWPSELAKQRGRAGDQREAAASAGSRWPRRRSPRPRADALVRRGAAPEHVHPRALHRGRGQEDGGGGGERRAHPAGREHLHVLGRDRRPRRPRHPRGGGGRGGGERGEGRRAASPPR